MTVAATRNIAFTQGDAYDHELTFSGDVVDVSGWTITAQVRQYPQATAYEAFAVGMDDAVTGVVVLSLTAAQTVGLPESCVWDVQRVVGGKPLTFLAGDVTVTREVTR